MQLANRLWASGIKAEFGFKPNPKMGDQLGYALEQGIPFMVLFGDDELKQGVVKVGVCGGGGTLWWGFTVNAGVCRKGRGPDGLWWYFSSCE